MSTNNENSHKVQHDAKLPIVRILITSEPPIGTWCYGRKGTDYKVIDKGEYYMVASDINKDKDRRCIPKDFAVVIV